MQNTKNKLRIKKYLTKKLLKVAFVLVENNSILIVFFFINYKIIFVFIIVNNWNLEQINIVIIFFIKILTKKSI